MTDGEFIIDTMKASRKQFPEFYNTYETHRLKGLQWSIQTMRLHAKEFRLDMGGHEELCKREYSAMMIKNAKPDPVEFRSTVQHWISKTFKEYETFDNITAASRFATDTESEISLEDPEYWQEALTDETFVELVIEKLRPHIPTMITMYDIDLYKGQPWNIDTLKNFLRRLDRANWKPALSFNQREVTPTLNQRFSGKTMKYPEYSTPLITESCNSTPISMKYPPNTQRGHRK